VMSKFTDSALMLSRAALPIDVSEFRCPAKLILGLSRGI